VRFRLGPFLIMWQGWLGSTPLLPCHYFVHSLGSRVTYRLRMKGRDLSGPLDQSPARVMEMQGQGWAHMESNHGNHFPAGWIWAQCVSQLRDVKLVR
jgi:hypothetical protein